MAQRFQPLLHAVDFEDIHPSGRAVVERPLQKTGAEQPVERPRDFHEIVADVGSKLLTAEDDTRMPREEEQQVEVACVAQTSRFNELHGHGIVGLNFLDAGAPFGGVHERQRQRYVRKPRIRLEWAPRNASVSLVSIMPAQWGVYP